MMLLSTVAALLLGLLFTVVLLRDRRTESVSLAVAVLLLAFIEIFDQLAVQGIGEFFSFKQVVLFLKSLLPASLLVYGFSCSRRRSGMAGWLPKLGLLAPSILFPLSVLVFPLGEFFEPVILPGDRVLPLARVGYWFYTGLMVYSILALVNLEATFSSTPGHDRWRIKFEFLGVAGILAVMIFYFSQGLLYRSVNMNLLPVRSVVLMAAALMIGYSKLFRGEGVRVTVSRYVFYRSFTLLAVGAYLLFLGLAGEGMRYFGVPFSRDLTILLAFLTGIAFLLVFFSEAVRRRAKIFINKHFYAQKRDYREEWLAFSGALAACRSLEDLRRTIERTFIGSFGLKSAALYLLNRSRDLYELPRGRPAGYPDSVEISDALRAYLLKPRRVWAPASRDYSPSPDEAEFARQARASLVVPLVVGDVLEGLVVMGPQLAREELDYEDYDLAGTLARQAAQSLANYRLAEELAEAREMAAVAKVSSFVIHDLKNLASALSLLLENADGHISNPDFQRDMVKSIRATASRMQDLIKRLRSFPEKQALRLEDVDLGALIRETVEEVSKGRPGTQVVCEGGAVRGFVDSTELRKVVLNLLFNAMDATGGGGTVKIGWDSDKGGVASFSVEDDGCGMSEYFIQNHLFKPFRTTKDKGLGIGLYQCRQIVESHGGRIEVRSRVGSGSVFTVYLGGGDPARLSSD